MQLHNRRKEENPEIIEAKKRNVFWDNIWKTVTSGLLMMLIAGVVSYGKSFIEKQDEILKTLATYNAENIKLKEKVILLEAKFITLDTKYVSLELVKRMEQALMILDLQGSRAVPSRELRKAINEELRRAEQINERLKQKEIDRIGLVITNSDSGSGGGDNDIHLGN